MAIQPLDYQSYYWKTTQTTEDPPVIESQCICGKTDNLTIPLGDFYPTDDGIPAFQVKLLPVTSVNFFQNPNFTGSAANWLLDNFAYNDNNVCLDNLSPTYIPSIRQDLAASSFKGEYYQIKIKYTNSGFPANPFTIRMVIKDSAFNIVETQNITPVTTLIEKEITFYWTVPYDETYTVWFFLIFDNTYPITQTVGFCFDNASMYLMDAVQGVQQYFQNNAPNVLSFTQQFNRDIALIELSGIDTNTNDCFRLYMNTAEDDYYYVSNLMKLSSLVPCLNQMLITWTDDCYFKDLDYANLPFTNSLYIKGYVRRLSNTTRERIQRVNGDGTADTVYDSSFGKVEVIIGLYTEYVHDILDRAMRHKTFTINGVQYKLDEGSQYTTVDLHNGYQTARVDMIKTGTEVVKDLCCCD